MSLKKKYKIYLILVLASIASTHPVGRRLFIRAIPWKRWVVDGAIGVFLGLGVTSTLLVANDCPAFVRDFAHDGFTSDTKGDLIACGVGLVGLAAASAASSAVIAGGATAAWAYFSGSGSAKRYMIPGDLDFGPGTLLANNTAAGREVWYNHTLEVYSAVSDALNEHGLSSLHVTAPPAGIYIQHEGNWEHHAYALHMVGSDHNKVAVIHADDLSTVMAAYAEHMKTGSTVSTKNVNSTLTKRSTTYEWASYDLWGVNDGYCEDIIQWEEWVTFINDYDLEDDIGIIGQVQPCTTQGCYGYLEKYCATWGFSETQGVDSAMVGEIYMDAWGGVDSECYDG